ncbi:MAG: hypothetical protein RJA07_127 [Bacteroidota bacterium]|jgi:thiol-disulfide isomerase/thioredoxin
MTIDNFKINQFGKISTAFKERNVESFYEAISFMKNLPYGRNENKEDLITVFADGCGTCSTKHALLKTLATENNFDGVKLYIGLFKMNSKNTPEISDTLKQNNIEYIPEAHCYLKINNEIIDATKLDSKPEDFINDLIEEIEIMPNQILNFKVDYHKKYLENWLKENEQIKFTLKKIWAIREQCIKDLATD